MLKFKITILLVLGLIIIQGCNQGNGTGPTEQTNQPMDRAEKEEKILAYVNETVITQSYIDQRFEMFGRGKGQSEPGKTEFQRALKDLINEELLLQEAKRLGQERDDDIQARVRQYERRLIVEKLKKNLATDAGDINEEKISTYYDTHREQFNIPPMLKLRQIVVVDKVTADNLHAKLTKDDSSFAEMARRYSVDAATKGRGGVIGAYRKGTKEKAFEEAAYGVKEPMQFAPVFQTQQGYHILQLLERREGVSRSLEQVKPLIRRRIAVEKEKKLLEDLLLKLKEGAKIKIVYEPDA